MLHPLRQALRAAAIAALAFSAPALAAADGIAVSDAWARPSIPNRPMAAYFTVINTGESADRLLGASAEGFDAVEIHTMRRDGDVMRMERVEAIPVAPGETVEVTPGGLHLMLFGAKRVHAEGESFPLTLDFEGAGPVEVEVAVSRKGAPGHGGAGGHGMGHGQHGN
jgi:copper(I)-binding protein